MSVNVEINPQISIKVELLQSKLLFHDLNRQSPVLKMIQILPLGGGQGKWNYA